LRYTETDFVAMNDLFTQLPLPYSFYQRPAEVVAPELLGKILVRRINGLILAGQITEVEAYLGETDPASHAYRGLTKRNASIFKAGGHLYVHQIHRYHCVDIVTNTRQVAGSVLIRAVRPLIGIEWMQKQRGTLNLNQLTDGPGKLCQAFSITKALDGISVVEEQSPVHLVESKQVFSEKVQTSARIGISQAQEMQLRFFVEAKK
jgi:DNA-3-methyladenine glycosylase